ncbi:AGAP001725-PA-like protein [Anopheles sinensis]|uniref:AGAP001725-PA-like protein n=1 Tax=Anopheles sinensis TaxID=74873 RepID=A0A084VLC5_ANOSI|nr:AGAP001725-PA-like protein [Anopheles sinensis]
MNTITIPSIDPTTFCRVCFAEINLLITICPDTVNEKTTQHLLQLVKTYLGLEFGGANDFRCAVCEVCYRLLREFDLLYQNAQQNNEALKLLVDSELNSQSKSYQSTQDALDTQDTTVVEIVGQSSPRVVHESIVDNVRHVKTEEEDFFDGEIILEEVPYTDTSHEEHQVHVFHVDGELQQVIIAGERSNNKGSRNGAKSPVVLNRARKQTGSSNGRPQLKQTTVQRPSLKSSFQSMKTLESGRTVTKVMPQQPQKATTMVRRVEKDTRTVQSRKLYRCNNCSSLFGEQSEYFNHDCIAKTRPPSPERRMMQCAVKPAPYRCPKCNVSYRREIHLEKHLYEAHGVVSENFGITCMICQIQFSQRQDYELHVAAMH